MRGILSPHWPVDLSLGTTLCVEENPRSRAYLNLYDPQAEDALALMEEGVSRSLIYLHLYNPQPESTTRFHGLHIDYSNHELAKQIVELIADDPLLIVDNDFGTVLSGNAFVARIRADRTWNWRNDSI
jgi:hypothetical protein